MMAIPLRQRVKTHREKLKANGLRPVQIWVPDTRKQGFAAECRRQCQIIADDKDSEKDIMGWVEAIRDTEGWTWE